ncbi:MAG: hypothetical protein AB7P14_21185 [Blastocatellales bacterium]
MRSRFVLSLSLLLFTVAVATAQTPAAQDNFAVIEGVFHDGLGTFAELKLANKLIELGQISQQPFDLRASESKMREAIERLPANHPARRKFESEKNNIAAAAERGAAELLKRAGNSSPIRVHHTARDFSNAKAADLVIELPSGARWPVSVKMEKSNKIAVAEGQTPDIQTKWAERYFRVSPAELDSMIRELGFDSMADLKTNYLNVSRLVAEILIRKMGLSDCQPNDFSRARVTDLEAVKFLFRQLLHFKRGNDGSTVIIFDRENGDVQWESKLEEVDIDRLTADRISFRPSRPRINPIASEFGIKIDGQAVVTFQIKHKRGRNRGGQHQFEFSDITTRLIL